MLVQLLLCQCLYTWWQRASAAVAVSMVMARFTYHKKEYQGSLSDVVFHKSSIATMCSSVDYNKQQIHNTVTAAITERGSGDITTWYRVQYSISQ